MEVAKVTAGSAVRWDTYSNRIYFNVEKGSLAGRLVLTKSFDGKIDMHIVKNENLTARSF
ncbi:MAG: hypothetical protein P4N59_12090 [Negativicutes bacterium]|nr:hypothetical protein [Negativicutes bacterium]